MRKQKKQKENLKQISRLQSAFGKNLAQTPGAPSEMKEKTIEELGKLRRALEESNEKYRVLFESFPLGLSITDADGKLIEANRESERLLGISRDEHARRKLDSPEWKIIRPDGTPMQPDEYASVRALKENRLVESEEMGIVKGEGEVMWISVTAAPIPLKNYGVAIAYGDITARISAEASLRESEEKLSHAFHMSPYAITITRIEDGRFIDVSDAFSLITGFTRDEAINSSSIKLDLWANGEDRNHVINELMSGRKVTEQEFQFKKKNGDIITGLFSAEVINLMNGRFILSSINDITDRKRAEDEIRQKNEELVAVNTRYEEIVRTQEKSRLALLSILEDEKIARISLCESEEKYRALVENINDVIYTLDASGVITYVSPAVERNSHYRVDELIGTHFDKIVHHEDLPGLMADFTNTLAGKISEYVFRIVDKDGSIRYVRTSSRIIFNDGLITGVTAIMTDITDRKIAEIRLQELYSDLERKIVERTADLEKANKELESFSYTVSHDLRAPLRHINGFLEMFRREMGDIANDKARHYMEVINESASHMGNLIDDLLSFSRTGKTELTEKSIDMETLADEVLKEHSEEIAGRSLQLTRKPLPATHGDRAMLRVVLVNLISNAVKFTKNIESPSIEIGFDDQEDRRAYYVRDNGAGFDMRYADKLFGVFQRLHGDQDFEGTGIGLATVKRIVERHGGRVWAEGEVGRGACFFFSLPVESSKERYN